MKAFVTGITGQDGSYLTELLLDKGYQVHGLIRRASLFNTGRIEHLYQDPHVRDVRLFLHYGDMTDGGRLRDLLSDINPDEVYNLAAQSHVRVSFDQPKDTFNINATGTLNLLEAVRRSCADARVYQASSSEMFGSARPPQTEVTPFHPRSPYGVSKVAAFSTAVNYREAYDIFVANGILFNHESPRRGETFVTRKITRAVGRIRAGTQKKLYLGYLDATRDWGYAPDYVEAMWRMLQAKEPDDFVIATGRSWSVRQFAERAFAIANLDYRKYVDYDARYARPSEVEALEGRFDKAELVLGWKPKTPIETWLAEMVQYDIDLAMIENVVGNATGRMP